MTTLKHLAAFAVVAIVGAGSTWVYAQQFKRGSHVGLSPEDYIEISQLYSFYPRDVDPGSIRNADWMFTDDGTADMGGRKYTGRDQLKEFYAGVPKNQHHGVRHFNTSYVIVGTPEGARGSSYMMQVERRTKDGPIEVTLFGKYEDRFVKTKDGWRIKERVFRPDSFRGADDPVMPSPVPGGK